MVLYGDNVIYPNTIQAEHTRALTPLLCIYGRSVESAWGVIPLDIKQVVRQLQLTSWNEIRLINSID
jgi:hypothetical protein